MTLKRRYCEATPFANVLEGVVVHVMWQKSHGMTTTKA